MRFFLTILLIVSFLFPQAIVEEDECFSAEEIQNIELHITELEQKDSKNTGIITNLNDQIKLYMEKSANDSLLISLNFRKSLLLNDQIKLYNDLVKQVKPKWYENKWLWFTIGVVTTAGTLKLASELVD